MRPLELRLRNFRSFYGDGHTFNFRDRRLIGVVGPIGSGKSTVLDAIAFALYGRTPRIGHATRSLIHQRAQQGTVALRFEIEGEVWEAVRQLRRTGASQHALYRLADDEPGEQAVEKVLMEREVNNRVVELLGLDYQGFGRSVMLAQGQFAQFLTARPAQRDKVLKGVFGYERVGEIRELARDALRTAEHEIDKLNIRIDHAEAAKARLDERRDDLAETMRRLEALKTALPLFRELTERISQSDKRRSRAERRLAELGTRSGELPDPVQGERVLDTAEKARIWSAGAERELRAADNRLEGAEAALESQEFERGRERLEEATRLVVQLKAAWERIEARLGELRDRARELPDRIKGIQAVALAEYSWASRVEASGKWEVATACLEDAEGIVASEEFAARETSVDKAGGLIVQLQAGKESALRAARETIRISTILQEDEISGETARSALTFASSELKEASAVAEKATSGLREAEGQLQDARHADMAGSLREQLTSGGTCPVCEQPVHRVPAAARGDSAAAQAALDQALSARDAAEERLRNTIGTARAAKERLIAAEDRTAGSRRRLAEARAEGERHDSLLDQCQEELQRVLGEGDPVVRLEEERTALDGLRSAVREARKVREEKRTALDAALEEERRARQALSDLRTRIGRLGTMLHIDFDVPEGDPDAVRTALASLHADWRRTMTHLDDALRTEQHKIEAASVEQAGEQARVDAFDAAIDRARIVRDDAREARDDALTFEQEAQRELSHLRLRIGTLGVHLDRGFQVPEDDPDALRSALASLHAGWTGTTNGLELIVRDQHSDALVAAARLDQERARHGIEGSINAALAEVRARREQTETDIEREEGLVAGAVELVHERRRRKNDVRLNRRLVRDLTDSRFIRFLLDEERAVLADLGSEHFERLSSGRYRFTEEGDFHVVDLNSADAIRRADSLSGGETFLASLALALGLAEMVGRRGGRLDAFFLDEGFGTLDPEHLDLAMEGVESLVADRAQRLVVVVSHVSELRQRIEDLIVLDKDPLTGDSIVAHGGVR